MGEDVRARCGYAIEDEDGEQAPCDRPATGWRWYQDVGEHEDLLDVACDWHANEGGRRIHEAEEAVRAAAPDGLREAVEGLAAQWEEWSRTRSTTRIDAFRDAAERLREVLAAHPAPGGGDPA